MSEVSAPRFSIVVPAYNAESTLAETLDAVRAQSFADWECVVVDDGSTDGTRAIAESYADKDARFTVVTQENQGSAGAYNTGVGEATGQFVVICSADDVLLPNHLEESNAFIVDEPEYDIYSSNGYFWKPDEGSRELVYAEGVRDEVMSLSLADVIGLCFFSVGAVYRRELFDRVGGYRVDVFGEDYDFWLRTMATGARHRYLPEALSLHRVSTTQKSANLERAYRSDIRLVSDLRESTTLSGAEVTAVEASIHHRERLIAQLGHGASRRTIRQGVAAAMCAMLGEQRAERVISRMRSLGR